MANFQPLIDEITHLTSVSASAVALINGFHQRLLDAIAADNLADDSAVVAFAAQVKAQVDPLSEAVAAGTEAPSA